MDPTKYGNGFTEFSDLIAEIMHKSDDAPQINLAVGISDGELPDKETILKLIKNMRIECLLVSSVHSASCDDLIQQFASMGIKVTVISDGDTIDDFPGLDSTRRMQIFHPEED